MNYSIRGGGGGGKEKWRMNKDTCRIEEDEDLHIPQSFDQLILQLHLIHHNIQYSKIKLIIHTLYYMYMYIVMYNM